MSRSLTNEFIGCNLTFKRHKQKKETNKQTQFGKAHLNWSVSNTPTFQYLLQITAVHQIFITQSWLYFKFATHRNNNTAAEDTYRVFSLPCCSEIVEKIPLVCDSIANLPFELPLQMTTNDSTEQNIPQAKCWVCTESVPFL